MPKATKRKVRRMRQRPKPSWMFGNGFYAPIYGEDMRVLHHFVPVDFVDVECCQRHGVLALSFLRTHMKAAP